LKGTKRTPGDRTEQEKLAEEAAAASPHRGATEEVVGGASPGTGSEEETPENAGPPERRRGRKV
jgi:hypothetical protein